ncbi:ABC transporter permease [[Clostridium] dakarense]|uniref:ABC transporter permease n=1 Tax=Faecalimicrobium dakarense TaxID=1301100 RepID=UPI0004AE6B19|nr:FtsX-like permease family protein [[Clostridium] dakarense]
MNSIINNIVKSNLKENKLRSIMVMIAVVLTTTLLTSVGIITLTMMQNQKERTIEGYGNAHAYYRKLEEEQVEKLKAHKDVEIFGINGSQIGKFELDESLFGFGYVDENALDLSNKSIIKGTFPTKSNEVLIDKKGLKKLGYSDEVGQTIKIKFHDINKNYTEKDFIVSGIIPLDEGSEANNAHMIIVSKKFMKENNYKTSLRANIRIKNEDKLSRVELEEKINEVASSLGFKEENTVLNSMYLLWMKPNPTTVLCAVVVCLVIMFSAILVIYNIFYISIINRIQDFGKLKAIGCTKKQLKQIIIKEGMILSIIAIPLGITLGYIISSLILNNILGLIGEKATNLSIKTNSSIIIGSAILTLLTVYISLLKPSKIAAKISPVEAMKYIESNNDSKKKNRKGYIDIDVLKLTKANLYRNKKRTLITVLSLSLSGMLIIAASTVMMSINTEQMVKYGLAGDFSFGHKYIGYDFEKEKADFINNNPLNQDFINNIKNIDGVERIDEIREIKVTTPNIGGEMKKVEPELKDVEIDLDGYTDDMLKLAGSDLTSGKFNLEKIKSGEEVLINGSAEHWNGFKVGDIITLTVNEDNKKVDKKVRVQGRTKYHLGGEVITSIDFITNPKYITSISISVDKNKEESIGKALTNISNEYKKLNYSSYKERLENYEKSFMSTNMMGYSLITIIGVISLVNLINTMITSILSRKKEIGILQAIGMSDKQLLKMLKLEGVFYTISTLVFSLIFGSAIGYLGYKVMYNTGAEYMIYKFPIVPGLIVVVVMVLVQFVIGYIINKIFNKESLIDRVRYSEN